MQRKLRLLLLFYMFGMGLIHVTCQSVTSSSGGENKSSTAQLSWTLGEVITETSFSQAVNLTQGYQQSRLEVISLDEQNSAKAFCNVYPNPTSENIVIEFEGQLEKDTKFSIFDTNGTEVLQSKIEEARSYVSLKNFSAGSYIIRITSPGLSGGNFRIIKTN